MADGSAIEWTEATWNPVTGCAKVSPGCAHCYAETFAERWRGIPGHPYEQGFDLRLWPHRLDQPLRWRRARVIFVNSMSDVFHEDIPEDFLREIFDVMVAAPRHTFQVLTKRPDRMRELAESLPWAPNIWMGVTIENRRFVERADLLRAVPAAVRFISAEPLLGPLRFPRGQNSWPDYDGPELSLDGIDWLIAGGESGARHRPVHPQWIVDLRDACAQTSTAFFFKQWGGRTSKSRGRTLEDRLWDAMPHPRPRDPTYAQRALAPGSRGATLLTV
jgi:protein gp37